MHRKLITISPITLSLIYNVNFIILKITGTIEFSSLTTVNVISILLSRKSNLIKENQSLAASSEKKCSQ